MIRLSGVWARARSACQAGLDRSAVGIYCIILSIIKLAVAEMKVASERSTS